MDVPFQGTAFAAEWSSRKCFRIALAASVALHAAGILTSPYWQPARTAIDEVLTVDIADVPSREMPKIPNLPPPAPEAPATGARPSPAESPPAPTREAIRDKVARTGLLRMFSRADGPARDADAGLKLPDEMRYASRGAAGEADYRATGRAGDPPAPPRPANPGIARQVEAASKSSAAMVSRVFRTDAGLDAQVSGAAGDTNERGLAAIAAKIREYQSGIRYVYNKELLANPNLSGEITVAFVILPNGSVGSAEIRQSTVKWPPLEDAVLKRMKHWTFPPTRGGPVRVVFPFKFLPEM